MNGPKSFSGECVGQSHREFGGKIASACIRSECMWLAVKVKISTLAGRNLRYLPAQKKRECGSSLRMTLTSPGMQPGASSPSHSKMNC